MAGPILYSTNPLMSFDICCNFRGGVHHVWCSEVFDPTSQASLTRGAMVAPSSSPCALARSLAADVFGEERHSKHIKGYQKTFRRLATAWAAAGEITDAQCQEIKDLISQPSYRIWSPLVYIIPRASIESTGRLNDVPVKKRAGHGPEYRILDLRTDEFDVMEWRCDD
jgi:hypothetical protein